CAHDAWAEGSRREKGRKRTIRSLLHVLEVSFRPRRQGGPVARRRAQGGAGRALHSRVKRRAVRSRMRAFTTTDSRSTHSSAPCAPAPPAPMFTVWMPAFAN